MYALIVNGKMTLTGTLDACINAGIHAEGLCDTVVVESITDGCLVAEVSVNRTFVMVNRLGNWQIIYRNAA